MAKLIYSMLMSLDGYIADRNGNFDWAEPDEEVHTFVNQLERGTGTYLYGRRMYEVMAAWETLGTDRDPGYIRDFGEMWRAAHKIVYTKTLSAVSTAKTRIERAFEPEAISKLKATAEWDISIGGPGLAAEAFKAGLVDVCQFFVVPIIVGGGTSAFPSEVRLSLNLLDERRFGNGMVYLHYESTRR
jgi:dihydrofolate reductase